LSEWQFQRKLTQRVEDIKPGDGFKEAWGKWSKSMTEWRKLQTEWKDPVKRKALLAKREEAKKKAAEEKGEEIKADVEVNFEDVDPSIVEDICDLGNGQPLFSSFGFEDWLLLSTRYELHLLMYSFKKDLDDADRPSFTEKDLPFYYHKYFKKVFNYKTFNCDCLAKLVDLISDTVQIAEKSAFLQPQLPEETDFALFVKFVEEGRRDRQRRLDAGDESAELKFNRTAAIPQPPSEKPAAWQPNRPGVPAIRPSAVSRPGVAPPRPPLMPNKRPAPAATPSAWVAKQPRSNLWR